jgi:glucose/arabinose dehydrogenase
MATRKGRTWGVGLAAALAWALGVAPSAQALPPGFQETTAFDGLTRPTVVRFAPDGRVLVAEKSGLVKMFSSLGDSTPETVADLRVQVYNFWDRGLLGLALDPNFSSNGRVYVLYTHDAPIGGVAPHRGSLVDPTNEGCPNPPGASSDGCVVSARLSRLTLDGTSHPPETVLIEDWCQQYPSHSIGTLEFDSAGALYASAGEGASFGFADWGQDGDPLNPCGDPPAGVGGTQTPPTAQGGALRSQDLRTAGDPVTLDGTVIRVDPATGQGLPSNPNGTSPDPNTRRIIAYGLRNPFRFTISPANELWIGDVGWGDWEELNRSSTVPSSVVNFGWPCYEGAARQGGYDAAGLNVCEGLYAAGAGAVRPPAFAYSHASRVVPGESCPTGSSSVSGIDFYESGPFPAPYDNALFFADYSRDCIWVMLAGAGGAPNPATVSTFIPGAANPTFIQAGPDGALYYTDFDGGRVQRVSFSTGNRAPTAAASATPTSGSAPLAVSFDGAGSSDPDPGDTLDYAWDLDGDGAFDDSTAVSPARTYTAPQTVDVGLQVTDDGGVSDTDTVRIDVGNDPPAPVIDGPTSAKLWRANELVPFSGHASDPQQGTLPASALDWELIINHCPSTCHQHPLEIFSDVASGAFTAPDHEYPSSLLLRLTATDAEGLAASTSVALNPRTVRITLESAPPGLELAFNGDIATAPLSRTVIAGSSNSVGAESPQVLGGQTYRFASWSDGGAAAHNLIANASGTLTATFTSDSDSGSSIVPSPITPGLEVRTLKLRIPKSVGRLIRRGGRAKLACTLDCVATLRLVAKGRDAKRARIAGTIAREVARLDAETPSWVVAKLRRRAIRRLERAELKLQPRVTATVKASPR